MNRFFHVLYMGRLNLVSAESNTVCLFAKKNMYWLGLICLGEGSCSGIVSVSKKRIRFVGYMFESRSFRR